MHIMKYNSLLNVYMNLKKNFFYHVSLPLKQNSYITGKNILENINSIK